MTLRDLLPAAPPVTVPAPATAPEGQEALRAWRAPALLVTDDEGRAVGVLTPAGVEAAPTLAADAPARAARAALRSAPAVIVQDGERPLGVLTAADLAEPAHADLAGRVWSALRPEDARVLLDLQALAGRGARVVLVGGAVRDALLGGTPSDLDVVVTGADVPALAAHWSAEHGGRALTHEAFGNATLTLPGERTLDLIRARTEQYPMPGANPEPRPGTLAQDLARRDFSVNALALPAGEDGLLDLHGGLGDLQARTLRPLHARSFREDPSRLVRGARLGARLGFAAHPELLAQVPDALDLAQRTPRLHAELRLLLQEPRPGRAARTLHAWGAGSLLPDGAAEHLEALDARQDAGEAVPPVVYAAALLAAAPDPAGLAARLGLGERPGALLQRSLGERPFPPGTPEAQLRARLRPDAYTPLTGRDVTALGVPPGPAVGRALGHLAQLRRAGVVRSREEEQAALRAYLTEGTCSDR
ncbi:CCA tRNA nucleotidyltransferase [Deinococcus maricopensis]|uniref:Polynucleotide adenylyltransferase region n=1 Tax=Deinococcus maricopensis (strain DSM 21211 / LMG 22137 / NRRL B-23946 / LB-34) TaxID=709986 RepID=E8U793_DEIML|nr:CCA tRNA nucleotidyltransferase [Deinococcus maricopensis]ADV66932.1 Polynucleotide adenylyltransferase region [Deinococcus maricopensis DSM 21211]